MNCNDIKYDMLRNHVDINMGQSPKSEFYNDNKEGLPFLQGNRTFGFKYPYYDTYCTDIKKVAEVGDVIFSVRAPVGDVNITTEKICIGRGIASLKMKNGNQEYLYYLLRNYKKYIENRESGTVFGSINRKGLEELVLPFPNSEKQNKIAKVLSSLDEKIELNNEMNKTLEEMAQALFKRWFIDFEFPNEDGEPYKSSGGEMVESELGMIPKKWEVKKIQDVGEVIAGGTPSTKNEEYYDGNIPWITPKDLSGYDRKFISKGERSITELGLQKSSAKLMRKGTVLFSSRAPIGYIVIAEEDVTTNQGFKSIACNEDIINNNYVYYYLKFNKEKIENIASGSTFKEVSGATMKMFDILVPTIDILNKFKDVVESYDDILRTNYIENDALIQIRDSLLPKLMSGEIRVEDVEANQ